MQSRESSQEMRMFKSPSADSQRAPILSSQRPASGLRWCLLLIFLASATMTIGCKKKKIDAGNVEGSILVMQPATERDRIIKKSLTLKVKLFDVERLAHFKVIFQKKVLWEKWFPPNKFNEKVLEKKLDLSSMDFKDGRDRLHMSLQDQTGAVSKTSIELFIDRRGPHVAWEYPKPGTTLRVRTKVVLKANDSSEIQWVKLKHNNKVIHTFSGGGDAPYRFWLDPGHYPAGNTTFWLHAKDSLGNLSARSVTFLIVGASAGKPCSFSDSCKSPLICVKRKGSVRGYCRKRCRRNMDCDDGYKCLRINGVRVCEQPYFVTKKGVQVAALFERCSRTLPCGSGLVCIAPPGRGATCRQRCPNGRCRRGFKCRKVPWGTRGQTIRACIELRPIKRKLQRIGQPCGPRKPCVKEAMCVRAGQQAAKCYKICSSRGDCPSGVRCNRVPGKSESVCVNLPRQRVRKVGAYAKCNRSNVCNSGLQCMSSGSGKPICMPKCGGAYCDSGSICLTLGGVSLCLSKCNPNSGSCPSGTRCRFLMRNKKGGYFCG